MKLLWVSLTLLALCLSVRGGCVPYCTCTNVCWRTARSEAAAAVKAEEAEKAEKDAERGLQQRLVNGEAAGREEFLRFNFAIRLASLHTFLHPVTQKNVTIIMTQCLGVLYDATTVITVAHCARHASLIPKAICGMEVKQLRDVESVTLHPSFNDSSSGFLANDVAVIKLDKAFNLTSECDVAQLPASAQNYDFQRVTVFGYNTTGAPFLWFLQAFVTIDQMIAPACFCSQYFNNKYNSSLHVCLIDEQQPRTQMACLNDHGTAAMLDDGTVVGIGSWATFFCKWGIPNYPSVYVRLDNYLDWFATFKD